jgi:2-polyprenyl-3-methyl-5-hydroxy-6-metoxy-1,4-benzoquinol methylase
MDACGCDGFSEIFDARTARHDLRRYREHGPDRTTALLLGMLRAAGVADASVLDIGAGVGVIDHELLASGADRAVLVDGAAAYQAAARQEAGVRGTLDRLTFVEGDFVALADRVEPADVVTLDRVVCCYPDMDGLVQASASHALRLYGLVLPRDRAVTRWGLALVNGWYRLRGRAYRAYVHPNAKVDAVVAQAGLRPTGEATTLFWRVVLYARPEVAAA